TTERGAGPRGPDFSRRSAERAITVRCYQKWGQTPKKLAKPARLWGGRKRVAGPARTRTCGPPRGHCFFLPACLPCLPARLRAGRERLSGVSSKAHPTEGFSSTNGKQRMRRVVVTGIGAVSPLGLDVLSTWQGITKGES